MEIKICVTFFEGKGHCYVTIIPSDYDVKKYTSSACYLYELEQGSYEIELQGVSPARVLVEVFDDEGEIIGSKEIKKQGPFQRSLTITI